MIKGYYVGRTRQGERPEYFYSRNYKWLKEPTEGCIYKDKKRAERALEKCKKTYGDNNTRFALSGVDVKI